MSTPTRRQRLWDVEAANCDEDVTVWAVHLPAEGTVNFDIGVESETESESYSLSISDKILEDHTPAEVLSFVFQCIEEVEGELYEQW